MKKDGRLIYMQIRPGYRSPRITIKKEIQLELSQQEGMDPTERLYSR